MTSKIEDGGPAFPQHDLSAYGFGPSERGEHGASGEPDDFGTRHYTVEGMSLRDYFAGQFISRFANSDGEPLDVKDAADQFDVDCALREHWSHAARTAYIAADCMIAARKAGS